MCIFFQTHIYGYDTAVQTGLEDGYYTVEVKLEGGTGRAAITSPAVMEVKDGAACVHIEWSSPNYDYMLVGQNKYLPVNEAGNSVFEIPLLVFDEPMEVIADTTAMSVPHEITYRLTFAQNSIREAEDGGVHGLIPGIIVLCLILSAVILLWIKRGKNNRIMKGRMK